MPKARGERLAPHDAVVASVIEIAAACPDTQDYSATGQQEASRQGVATMAGIHFAPQKVFDVETVLYYNEVLL